MKEAFEDKIEDFAVEVYDDQLRSKEGITDRKKLLGKLSVGHYDEKLDHYKTIMARTFKRRLDRLKDQESKSRQIE